jgi:hypothetical protein
MSSETPQEKTDRIKAKKRAKKMFRILFKQEYYKKIMDVLNSTSPQRSDLDPILDHILTTAEQDWLWNYLSHCQETGTGGWGNEDVLEAPDEEVDEAASVGW